MPIRPENRARYPKDWKTVRARILERAGHKCESCGVVDGAVGGRTGDGTWVYAQPGCGAANAGTYPKPGAVGFCGPPGSGLVLPLVRIVLTIAHLDHTPENCEPSNLRAWCQRCHNRYDAKMRAAGIKARRRARYAIGDLV